ncbi:MAG: hypothetical protein ABIS36_00440 [Chryseolinea sp.]
MLTQLIFRLLPASQKVNYLQTKGVSLGSRLKDGRRLYVYMLGELFVEVLYANDNASETAEKIYMLRGLKNLNAYLEQEFRASF